MLFARAAAAASTYIEKFDVVLEILHITVRTHLTQLVHCMKRNMKCIYHRSGNFFLKNIKAKERFLEALSCLGTAIVAFF